MTRPPQAHAVTISRGARLAATGLLLLVLIVGGGNLWATYAQVSAAKAAQHHEQVLQQRAGARVVRELCATFGRLAALSPPPGNPQKNPSRAYLQGEHATLDQIGTDLGCSKGSR